MNDISYRRLDANSENDTADLQRIFEQSLRYFQLVEGQHTKSNAAAEELQQLPPGKSLIDKYFFGIQRDDQLIGCIDIIKGYPQTDIAYIGLLLLLESEQDKSIGVHALKYIKKIACEWGSATLRAAVVETNVSALKFWQREGFSQISKQTSVRYTGEVIVMEYVL